MILNGAYLGFILGPRVTSFAPPPGAAQPSDPDAGRSPGPPPELLRLQGRMTILSWLQVGLAVAVLLLVRLLTA